MTDTRDRREWDAYNHGLSSRVYLRLNINSHLQADGYFIKSH